VRIWAVSIGNNKRVPQGTITINATQKTRLLGLLLIALGDGAGKHIDRPARREGRDDANWLRGEGAGRSCYQQKDKDPEDEIKRGPSPIQKERGRPSTCSAR
jgi:hypothetical protein